MSASMYNNPYVYKAPPPRIVYPSMFGGLSRISFRHILDSKFLALAALLQGVGTLVIMITIINPFWYKLSLSEGDGTFGTEPTMKKVVINTGLFYMDESKFDNTAFLNKYTGKDVVPQLLIRAQVFSVIGTCLLVSCLAGTVILVFRRFGSLTATLILAFFSSVAGILQILVFVMALFVVILSNCKPNDSGCKYEDNLVWRMIPIYTQFYRVEPHITPYVEPNWALFVALIGAIIASVGAAMIWVETMFLYRNVNTIRYEQLRRARDPHEKDVNLTSSRQPYVYRPPVQYGVNTYGMQPVVQSVGPYGDVFYPASAPQRPAPHIGFSTPGYYDSDSEPQRRPPSPGFVKRPPPSESSSVSAGPNISREINL